MSEGVRIVGPVPAETDPEVEKAFAPLRRKARALGRAWAAEERSNGSPNESRGAPRRTVGAR